VGPVTHLEKAPGMRPPEPSSSAPEGEGIDRPARRGDDPGKGIILWSIFS
jgi:hypothetical protein